MNINTTNTLFPPITAHINQYLQHLSLDRKKHLKGIMAYIKQKKNNNEPINLHFVCTHNSRRSQLAQVWAETLSYYFNLDIKSYSYGNQATIVSENVLNTLQNIGFKLHKASPSSSHLLSYSQKKQAIKLYAKTIDDPFLVHENFIVLMTCDSAGEHCPVVQGAEQIFPLYYQDPSKYDGSDRCMDKYFEKSVEIASDIYFIFNNL